MDSEISVKIAFNDEMRRFSFQGSSFNALREHVIGLLGITNADNVVLKYTDEDGDLITLSSDLELKTAAVPGKVLRLQVAQKNAAPAVIAPAPEPMDVQRAVPNPFIGFGNGCGAPAAHPHPPPGFFGQPQHPFPHHGHPHPHGPHHGPHHHGPHQHGPHQHGPYHQKPKHEWAKIKEERKKAKKNMSKEDYEKYKEQHKAEYKQQKHAFKEAMKGKKCKKGKWGKHGPGHGHGPHPHHARGFPPHMGGMPFAPAPFGAPPVPPTPGFYPPFGGFPQGRGFGPQAGEKLVARHVKDVTVEDGMQLPPNTPFTKTWRVRNEGPAWPAGCRLFFVSKRCGDILGGPEFVTVEGPVQPNQEVDISVNLVSPTKPGKYTGFWRFCQPDGRKFGQRMWVSIVVPSLGSSSSDEEERLADRYEVLVDSVLALGFTAKRHRVFRLLQKCDGNVEEVANILAEKSQRKADKADRACRD